MSADTNEPMQALLQQQQALFKQWIDEQTSRAEPAEKISPDTSRDMARVAAILSSQTTDFLQFGNNILTQLETNPTKSSLEEPLTQFRDFVQQQSGEALLTQWQLPENVAALFRTHSFQDDILFENPYTSGLKSLLNFPSVGATHEFQQNTRDGIKYLLEYQDAMSEYIEQYSQINLQATKALMQDLTEGSDVIETLGQLHDLWVNCYERTYADCLYTETYQKSHGRVSNAVMRLRKYAQDMRDIQFEALGLATRKGLDTALQRQHTLRKEMRKINKTLSSQDTPLVADRVEELTTIIHQLSADMTQLQQELAELKSQTVLTTGVINDEKS
ncbi:poly(R)-hydroxyalkanoic acid synthase subunit PhaE [Neptunomonas qingdaonensis]|uniref:Poly(3-hydroxyalkanoate) polymerase subunit PhaE n=1 Tax=Neptunomonas qingdaonensis TaxID=1045558 RepID=A0A1I2SZI9_9GAMM|nr:poly(R)-hydroxyalkanoic acid synthase subunit PhaE [Neptunomonas qingdaonensis]SFG58132.1 poly(R)-hydroxyalkanoic acid synthase, class III, PhaE subunit [Neptunomonas qingdaonensis]